MKVTMGRKAKLKKARKSLSKENNVMQNNSDKFIQHVERQGYSLRKPQTAPSMPEKRIDPQV